MVADIEDLENLDASAIHARRLSANEGGSHAEKVVNFSYSRSQMEPSSCRRSSFSEEPHQGTTMVFMESRTGLNH